MNLILFILIVVISFVAVRLGAVAFQLTGLEWSLAKFQSLSCFSGTGFTTREAELVTGHAKRRQIASFLMVLGNAGLVTLVATFANSIRPHVASQAIGRLWGLPPVANLLVMGLAVYLTYRFFGKTHAAAKLTDFLRHKVRKSRMVEPVTFEELAIATGGYAVVRADVPSGSRLVNRSLADSNLRARDITVLAVRRGKESIPNPPAATQLLEGDEVLCFGRLGKIRDEFQASSEAKSDV